MGMLCPKCRRESDNQDEMAGHRKRIYSLFLPFFLNYYCPRHGMIEWEEFSDEECERLQFFRTIWIGLSLLLLVLLINILFPSIE